MQRKRAQPFARLTSYPLIEVSIATTIMRPFFEQQEALSLKWTPMVSVPHFLIVPSMLQDNDCIGIMGRLAARKFASMGAVSILEISEPTPVVHYRLIWHKRRAHDPAHLWMREMIGAIAARKRQ